MLSIIRTPLAGDPLIDAAVWDMLSALDLAEQLPHITARAFAP